MTMSYDSKISCMYIMITTFCTFYSLNKSFKAVLWVMITLYCPSFYLLMLITVSVTCYK